MKKQGYKCAKQLTKKFARTFYFASLFLPGRMRYACYAVYAICRLSDESVDSNYGETAAKELKLISDKINLAYGDGLINDPLIYVFRETIRRYDIPRSYFDLLLEGMSIDIGKNRYENFEELYGYCYKAAGVIGLIMLRIFGDDNGSARIHAVKLGIAMQLTNIVRDIKEDFNNSRIYIPQDEMQRFSVSESHIRNGIVDNAFIELIKFQVSRARQYYSESSSGIKIIRLKRLRLVVAIMKNLYSSILEKIENNDYDVLNKRIEVNNFKKIKIIVCTILKGGY
ncbi:MAG: phytoene/squalene synthase family protein [Candidatus Omnitrophota bacterium]|jgi:phytoene synthase|nr:MAG: phytoene/squalene synthase family protein [Candidatus Omnitrophota bacterium]